MCGICGFAGEGSFDDLCRMNSLLTHRGPDDRDEWCAPERSLYLGHRRLSIIDIEYGHQPMWTGDGKLGIVYNGEIYNHAELRSELIELGHCFVTDHSDTEVLLYAYREWGEGFVERLNGMWAFALLDRSRNSFFLSRDRFGQKPLYYACRNRTFAFASELRALNSLPAVSSSPCQKAVRKYFAYGYIPAPLSFYQDIYKLPAGCSLTFDLGDFTCSVHRYWDFVLAPFEDIPENPVEEWGDELRHLLKQAVRRRLIADVPVGVFLSGGIDSSAVAACAVLASSSEQVKTFSIGFEEASFDESIPARSAAEYLGTKHHDKILSLESAHTLLPEITSRLDEPMGDSSLLPTYLLCRETRKRVTVALGGDGGDELFAGYDPFRALRLAELYTRIIPRPVHAAIRFLAAGLPVSHRNMSFDFKIKRTLRGLSYPKRFWNSVWLGTLPPEEIEEMVKEPIDPEELYSEAIEQWDACTQDNLIDKTLQFYTKLYLQDDILTKIDRASMMHSLEARSPFLDIDLVDFVRRIPARFKYRSGTTKYILKKALEPMLRQETIHRAKKGFGIPVGRWFQQEKLTFDPRSPGLAGLDTAFIERNLQKHRSGTQDQRAFLWNCWLLDGMMR